MASYIIFVAGGGGMNLMNLRALYESKGIFGAKIKYNSKWSFVKFFCKTNLIKIFPFSYFT